MKIGELARRTGVPVETLRYYEKRGLLAPPPRTPSGYRDYQRAAISTVRFIKGAQRFGFRLTDVDSLLRLSERDPSRCPDVQMIAAHRIAELRADIAGLQATCSELERLLGLCAQPRSSPRCPLLESLARPDSSAEKPTTTRSGDGSRRGGDELVVVADLPMRSPRIQILYVRGCPRVDEARAVVRLALSRTPLRVAIEELEGDYASPTVLVDGLDVTGRAGPLTPTCRLDPPTADQVVVALAARMRTCAECEAAHSPLTMVAFRELLRTGEPVAAARLATILHRSEPAVGAEISRLDRAGQIALGAHGQVVGAAGLSVAPCPHEVRAGGRRLWTWCAYDALGIMAALGASGDVFSRDPSTGAAIHVTCEGGVPTQSPVVLFLPGSECCAVPRDTWCPLANFFESAECAGAWAQAHGVAGSIVTPQAVAASAWAEWAALVPSAR